MYPPFMNFKLFAYKNSSSSIPKNAKNIKEKTLSPFTLYKYILNRSVVTNIVILILKPYAASILLLVLKNITTQLLHINNIILTAETYTCPFNSVGYFIINFGNRFNFIASDINVNDPVIKLWLAIIAASVANIT